MTPDERRRLEALEAGQARLELGQARVDARLAERDRDRDAERRRTISDVQADNRSTVDALRRFLDGAGIAKLPEIEAKLDAALLRDAARDKQAEELGRIVAEANAIKAAEARLKSDAKEAREIGEIKTRTRAPYIALGGVLIAAAIAATVAVVGSHNRGTQAPQHIERPGP